MALWQVFSKCLFLRHSAYFHSALYPSFRRKNPHRIFRKLLIDNFPHSAICIPQNTPSRTNHRDGLYIDLRTPTIKITV